MHAPCHGSSLFFITSHRVKSSFMGRCCNCVAPRADPATWLPSVTLPQTAVNEGIPRIASFLLVLGVCPSTEIELRWALPSRHRQGPGLSAQHQDSALSSYATVELVQYHANRPRNTKQNFRTLMTDIAATDFVLSLFVLVIWAFGSAASHLSRPES